MNIVISILFPLDSNPFLGASDLDLPLLRFSRPIKPFKPIRVEFSDFKLPKPAKSPPGVEFPDLKPPRPAKAPSGYGFPAFNFSVNMFFRFLLIARLIF